DLRIRPVPADAQDGGVERQQDHGQRRQRKGSVRRQQDGEGDQHGRYFEPPREPVDGADARPDEHGEHECEADRVERHRKRGITCLPKSSIDFMTAGCGMRSACISDRRWSRPAALYFSTFRITWSTSPTITMSSASSSSNVHSPFCIFAMSGYSLAIRSRYGVLLISRSAYSRCMPLPDGSAKPPSTRNA